MIKIFVKNLKNLSNILNYGMKINQTHKLLKQDYRQIMFGTFNFNLFYHSGFFLFNKFIFRNVPIKKEIKIKQTNFKNISHYFGYVLNLFYKSQIKFFLHKH